MIEIVEAVKGGKVIRFAGRLLASRFDPEAEARAWVANHQQFLDKVRTVIVLGLGSGHHVAELSRATSARVVVIEAHPEIIEAASQLAVIDQTRVAIEHVKSARGLRSNERIKRAVTESFVVLVHPASHAHATKLYDECAAQLIGRDWGALNWQWKLRNAPGFDAQPRIDGGGHKALTIYDLEQTELVQNSEEREKLLLNALRELVK